MRSRTATLLLAMAAAGFAASAWSLVPEDPSRTLARFGLAAAAFFSALAAALLSAYARRLSEAEAEEKFRREFTANVAHELKSPLTALLGAVETMEDSAGLPEEERRELYALAKEQCLRLNTLLRDVISLSRIEFEENDRRFSFRRMPISEVADTAMAVCGPAAKRAGVALTAVRGDSPEVFCDAELVERALVNLIENAIKHSGSDRVEVRVNSTGKCVELTVTDYGVGIPAHHIHRIFERFYRIDKCRARTQGGSGLGLAIVKHIARLHGGDAFARSEQGGRTDFVLAIPAAAREPTARTLRVAEDADS